jgi:hypothetical protein
MEYAALKERNMDPRKPTDPAKALDRVIIGLEIIAGAIIAGTFLANALTSFFTDEDDSTSPVPDDSPEPTSTKTDWAALGRSILSAKSPANQTLSDHLRCQYAGLYFIGRSRQRLSHSEAESLAIHLEHFHSQLGRRGDAEIAAWYQTVGVSHSTSLSLLLQNCPEVLELRVVPEFIAYAMGEIIDEDGVDWTKADDDLSELQQRELLD